MKPHPWKRTAAFTLMADDPRGPGWLYKGPNMSQPQDVQAGQLWHYLRNPETYFCPMDRPPLTMGFPAIPRPQQLSSYCMNHAVSGYGALHYQVYTIDRFKPNQVCFWESCEDTGWGAWNDGCNIPSEGISKRHASGGTLVCFDGHVEYMKQRNFNLEATNAPGRLWCNPGSANGR